jgi:hypothetical protein
MVRSSAEVATGHARRYLGQMCKHFGHRVPVVVTGDTGEIDLGIGVCRLEAGDGVLRLSLEASGAGRMGRLQDAVASHLVRFAFREALVVDWQPAYPLAWWRRVWKRVRVRRAPRSRG